MTMTVKVQFVVRGAENFITVDDVNSLVIYDYMRQDWRDFPKVYLFCFEHSEGEKSQYNQTRLGHELGLSFATITDSFANLMM